MALDLFDTAGDVGVDRRENVVNCGHLHVVPGDFRPPRLHVPAITPDLGRLAKGGRCGDNRASGEERWMAQLLDAGHAPFNRLSPEEVTTAYYRFHVKNSVSIFTMRNRNGLGKCGDKNAGTDGT